MPAKTAVHSAEVLADGQRSTAGCDFLTLMPPDQGLGPPELDKIRRPQPRLAGTEKLVQLRRLDRGAAEHGMHLPAMMDLVFEQMRQQA